jgi:ABC-type nitrate/sulfonate/bicarbonate transport system substrate-binding protein
MEIIQLPGAKSRDVSFGVFAARALQAGQIDGFWANAMGGETATTSGAGKILVDVRRGDDPAEIRFCTFAGMATSDAFLASRKRWPPRCAPSSGRRKLCAPIRRWRAK